MSGIISRILDDCQWWAEKIIAFDRPKRKKKIRIRALILVERDMRENYGGWWLPSQFRYDSYDIKYQRATTEEQETLKQQLPILKKLWAQKDRAYCSNGNKPLIAAYL